MQTQGVNELVIRRQRFIPDNLACTWTRNQILPRNVYREHDIDISVLGFRRYVKRWMKEEELHRMQSVYCLNRF